ncbi:hypothetical protein K504DRAFT_494283 [Pleomassaria siparia CBS 279.74]|uniref:SnoaL-like domain-containing protein n=1 Tax=Pleomassaria siparia CBS 279.74 TaxID=1314801 RepID=A0A6G1JXR2_9PLEO|nr:hypothetical protein K504DRAFT_494283 [Pleomassaria siparia CBS 279.74]
MANANANATGNVHGPTRRTTLLDRTHAFCAALLSSSSSPSPPAPADLVGAYFSSSDRHAVAPPAPRITEHGPSWASERLPFLGKTFSGPESCIEYFEVLGRVLDMQLPADAFPPKEGFIVDAEAGMVSVVGRGRFVSKKTGKGWDEEFVYRFSEYDDEGKFGHWEIWADPLSAWEAVGE